MEFGKLAPEKVRKNVVLASLYITAFDLLEMSIKKETKDFLTFMYLDDPEKAEQEYKKEVSDKYPFENRYGRKYYDDYRACVLWLRDINAIKGSSEVDALLKIRDHRNDIVHELPKLLLDEKFELDFSLFQELQRLHKKIMIFWARMKVIDVNPEYDGKEIKDEEIEPASVLFLEYILSTFVSKPTENR